MAWLFNTDAKHRMDDDLMRMKTYIETGKPPHDAALRHAGVQREVTPVPVQPSL